MRVFFDLDGVMADFDRGAKELCGYAPAMQGTGGPEEEERLFTALRKARHFFYQLEPIKGAAELFSAVNGRDGVECEILTAVPKKEHGMDSASEDKIRWVRKYLSEDVKVNTVSRREKKNFCLGKKDILIDDFSKNILEWEMAGGTGILFVNTEQTERELRKIGVLAS